MRVVHSRRTSTLKAVVNKKTIGYLTYTFPDDASAKGGNRNVEVSFIFVEKAHRRKGVATTLLAHFFNSLPNIVWVSLWTGKQAEIEKTYRLYKKNGFVEKAIMHDYYEPGVPTRLFIKRLS